MDAPLIDEQVLTDGKLNHGKFVPILFDPVNAEYYPEGKAGNAFSDGAKLKWRNNDIGSAQIYRVLHRHGWRKIMLRSRHSKKASEEVIATSKKLTTVSEN